jgi:hypothetical protein
MTRNFESVFGQRGNRALEGRMEGQQKSKFDSLVRFVGSVSPHLPARGRNRCTSQKPALAAVLAVRDTAPPLLRNKRPDGIEYALSLSVKYRQPLTIPEHLNLQDILKFRRQFVLSQCRRQADHLFGVEKVIRDVPSLRAATEKMSKYRVCGHEKSLPIQQNH